MILKKTWATINDIKKTWATINDIKKTWATINDIIKRDNKEEISECFLLDGKLSNDGKKIAEEFNSFFFSNIGLKI